MVTMKNFEKITAFILILIIFVFFPLLLMYDRQVNVKTDIRILCNSYVMHKQTIDEMDICSKY